MADPRLEWMVESQIVARGLHGPPRLLEVLRRLPRERFVPEAERARACADCPVPIGHGQTLSQPYMVALMTAALDPQPGEKALDIGTGSGYQAAVLAALGCRVHAIERIPELAEAAAQRLAALGLPVALCCGDGNLGWPEAAPFDCICVAARAPQAPPALLEQLNPAGGRLVMPVGPADVQELRLFTRHGDGTSIRDLGGCVFVSLV